MKKVIIVAKLYLRKEKFSIFLSIITGIFGSIGIAFIYTAFMFLYSQNLTNEVVELYNYKTTFIKLFSVIGISILICFICLIFFLKTYIYKKRKRDFFYFLNRGIPNNIIIFSLFLEDFSINMVFIICSAINSYIIFKYLPSSMNNVFVESMKFQLWLPILYTALIVLIIIVFNIMFSFNILVLGNSLKKIKEEN